MAAAAVVLTEPPRRVMGTWFAARVVAPDSATALRAMARGLAEMQRLERVLWLGGPDCELAEVNEHAAQRWMRLTPDLFAAMSIALQTARETDGAFDPTVEPLVVAWDLRGAGQVPEAAKLAELRKVVGWERVQIDSVARAVRYTSPGVAVDLGGLSKGFILDAMKRVMVEAGGLGAMLDLGGEILGFGQATTSRDTARIAPTEVTNAGWRVELPSPDQNLGAVLALQLRDQGVSTSGAGGLFFAAAARRYRHVLDPRTQRPTETPGTVSVVCRTAVRADALATAMLVIGRAEARRFLERRPEVGLAWMEPAVPAIRAWAWNLEVAQAPLGRQVEWQERAPAPKNR